MGQYYQPVILSENNKVLEWVYSHEYDNGLKLMEHSYIGNNFVRAFESLIHNNPKRVVWAGDYADKEPSGKNLFAKCTDNNKVRPETSLSDEDCRYLVNHTRYLYVDTLKRGKEWAIHPLPLLTSEGNGQGGGDFSGDDPDNLVGSWARDLISVQSDKTGLDGFNELEFDLEE